MVTRKTELARRLARGTRLGYGVVTDVVAMFERLVEDALRDGLTVQLMGLVLPSPQDRAEG